MGLRASQDLRSPSPIMAPGLGQNEEYVIRWDVAMVTALIQKLTTKK